MSLHPFNLHTMSYVELLWEYQRLRELYLEYPSEEVLRDLCNIEAEIVARGSGDDCIGEISLN